jgi:hypothetical protein
LIFIINQEIDTALLKLYAEENSPILEDLICSENACMYEDTVDWLRKHKVNILWWDIWDSVGFFL